MTAPRPRWVGPLLAILLLAGFAVATYPATLRGHVLLPADWLYEAYHPWRALRPDTLALNPRQNDAVAQLHPLDIYTRDQLRSMRIPLWNPYLGGGIPHLATGFTRALYPPFWLTLPFSPEAGRNAEILLHLVMAGFFQYLYLRATGCRGAAALLGGMAFGWSGALTVRTPLNYIFDTLAWLPLLLLGVERILAGRHGAIALLGLAAGMQLLAGSLPDVFSSWLLVVGYVAARMSFRPRAPVRALGAVMAAVLAAAGVSAAQLLPQLELVSLSQRGGQSYEALRATGASWQSLLSLVSPVLAGAEGARQSPIGDAARTVPLYVGAVSLALMPAGFRRGGGPMRALSAAAALVALVAAGTPLLYLLHASFPPLAGLRYVHTFGHVCPVALAAMAGWGAEAWLDAPRGPRRRVVAATIVAAIAIAGAMGGMLAAWYASDPRVAGAGSALCRSLLFVAGASLSLIAYRREWIAGSTLSMALILLSAADLGRVAARHNPVTDQRRFAVLPWTAGLRLVGDDPELVRTVSVQPRQSSRFGPWVAGPNLLQAYGIEDAGAYHSLLPARLVRYHTVMERMAEGASGEEARSSGRPFFVNLEHYGFRPTALARLMNIRYLLFRPTDVPDAGAGLRLVHDGEMRVYRYDGQLPRAFVASRYEVLGRPEQVLARLAEPGFDPADTVLLEAAPPLGRAFAGSRDHAVRRLDTGGIDSSAYEVRTGTGGLLVVCEAWYPGWSAAVNGVTTPLLRADYLFRAVVVPPGPSRVEMRYRPMSFRMGAVASALTLLALAVAAIRAAARRG